jgi:glutamate synthase domain-containing protein 3
LLNVARASGGMMFCGDSLGDYEEHHKSELINIISHRGSSARFDKFNLECGLKYINENEIEIYLFNWDSNKKEIIFNIPEKFKLCKDDHTINTINSNCLLLEGNSSIVMRAVK